MYSASDNYKSILKSSTSRNIAYAEVTDNTLNSTVTVNGAQIKLITIDADACPNKEILGSVVQGNMSVEFVGDIVSTLNLSHKYSIKPYIGVYLADGVTTEYVPYQPYIVSSWEYRQDTLTTVATCIDNMKKFDVKFTDSNTYPMKLLAFVQNLCSQAGVTLSNTSIFNGTFSIATLPYFNECQLKEVLSEACKVALSFAYINRTGQLVIKQLSTLKPISSVETIAKAQAREFTTYQDSFKTLGVNTIVLKLDNVVDGENITRSDSTMVTTDGSVEMSISNSPFLWNATIKASVIDAMITEIKGFRYKSYTVSSKLAPYLDLGDVITLTTSVDNSTIITTILAYSLKFDGAIRVDLSAIATTLTDTAYAYQGTLSTRVKNTEIMVDKVKGSISFITGDIETLDGRTTANESSIIVNSQAITSKVSQSYVDNKILEINSAKPNRVSNLPSNFEQGTLTLGVPASSALAIRTSAFYPVSSGYVTVQCADIYEAMVVIYNSSYVYQSSQAWGSLVTFNLLASSFFKVVLRSKIGNTVVPSEVATSNLKVANEETASMWNMYFGDLTLSAQKDLYQFKILSSTGLTFDGQTTLTLNAYVILDNIDVTSLMASSQFAWSRSSQDSAKDSNFNSLGLTGSSLTITSGYLDRTATYKCFFTISETAYLMTFTGNRILTKANSSTLVAITSGA